MTATPASEGFTYSARLDALRESKLRMTREKQELIGAMDHDDWGLVLPPPARRKIVRTMSSSGMPITDCLLEGFEPETNHPSGGFYGPRACGANFRALLECHPPYVDPLSSLAGAYMVNFMSYRKPHWDPDLSYAHLQPEIERYQLLPGIGATQHFCQDLAIGLELGWDGVLDKVRRYRRANAPHGAGLYDGLEDVVLGLQNWVGRTAVEARRLAAQESDPARRENLLEMAEMNERLASEPPRTFRDACQWILWYQIAARMYNGSGSLGRLDLLLQPYYERDVAAGVLTDQEAVFHIACLLLRDTAYIQLGGPDASGQDATNHVSFLILEAAHRLRIPANVGVCYGREVDPQLLRRGVEVLLADRTGIPKFLGSDSVVAGFARNGYPLELARERAYAGCHWYGLPGREYTLNDCVKINFGPVFDVALREMLAGASDPSGSRKPDGSRPSVAELWRRFENHLGRAVTAIAACLDFQLEHMYEVFPELVLDLLSHGPIERGLDASHGGVEYYNLCVDGAALATVADSFAALEQRVEREGRLSWAELLHQLDTDWARADGAEAPGTSSGSLRPGGAEASATSGGSLRPGGEQARLMMRSIPRYGSGGSRADEWAQRVAQTFSRLVKERPTPGGRTMIPGLFSWANTIPMGKELGATPNGRRAGEPISHGANPDPGFRKDGAPTALAVAIASVQPGYGNTAPMQIEVDPALSREEGAVEVIESLIKAHFGLGGTQININVMDAAQVLEAHKDPSKYPDLIVRVTGFSAYFASLSPEFRQLVVDRIIRESGGAV